MSLETPERIRSLQKKLYCKAKSDRTSLYLLYDKVWRDILRSLHVARRCRSAGVYGVSLAY